MAAADRSQKSRDPGVNADRFSRQDFAAELYDRHERVRHQPDSASDRWVWSLDAARKTE